MINQELIDDAIAAGFVISWGKISLLTDNDAIPIQDELIKLEELIKARVLADMVAVAEVAPSKDDSGIIGVDWVGGFTGIKLMYGTKLYTIKDK